MSKRLSTFAILLVLAVILTACDKEPDNSSASHTLKITTTVLPSTFNGLTYNQTLAAQDGTQPYSWSIVSGALPNGLTLDPNTGVISGVSNDAEGWNYYFTVQVVDAGNRTASADLLIFIDGTVVAHDSNTGG